LVVVGVVLPGFGRLTAGLDGIVVFPPPGGVKGATRAGALDVAVDGALVVCAFVVVELLALAVVTFFLAGFLVDVVAPVVVMVPCFLAVLLFMVLLFMSVLVVAPAFVPVLFIGVVAVVFVPGAPGTVPIVLSPALVLGAFVAADARSTAISDPAMNAVRASVETKDFFMVTSSGDSPFRSMLGHVLSDKRFSCASASRTHLISLRPAAAR
jgi:hypothetical protein